REHGSGGERRAWVDHELGGLAARAVRQRSGRRAFVARVLAGHAHALDLEVDTLHTKTLEPDEVLSKSALRTAFEVCACRLTAARVASGRFHRALARG